MVSKRFNIVSGTLDVDEAGVIRMDLQAGPLEPEPDPEPEPEPDPPVEPADVLVTDANASANGLEGPLANFFRTQFPPAPPRPVIRSTNVSGFGPQHIEVSSDSGTVLLVLTSTSPLDELVPSMTFLSHFSEASAAAGEGLYLRAWTTSNQVHATISIGIRDSLQTLHVIEIPASRERLDFASRSGKDTHVPIGGADIVCIMTRQQSDVLVYPVVPGYGDAVELAKSSHYLVVGVKIEPVGSPNSPPPGPPT